ncbi:hypothetical protein K1719_032507 [Acacia pycnantha]|nr:hypothetical protein K1719_032507 [Acacia pycnantha]
MESSSPPRASTSDAEADSTSPPLALRAKYPLVTHEVLSTRSSMTRDRRGPLKVPDLPSVAAKFGEQPCFLNGPEGPEVEWRFPLYWSVGHHELGSSSYQFTAKDLTVEEEVAVAKITSSMYGRGPRLPCLYEAGGRGATKEGTTKAGGRPLSPRRKRPPTLLPWLLRKPRLKRPRVLRRSCALPFSAASIHELAPLARLARGPRGGEPPLQGGRGVHAYLQLRGEYVKSTGEVQRLNVDLEMAHETAKRLAEKRRQAEAAKEQAEETSRRAVEELDHSNAAAGKATEELLLTKAALDQSNSKVARLQSAHSLSMDAVKTVTQQRCDLARELKGTRGSLEEQRTAYQKAVAAVKKTAEQCFKAALAQIQFLNPGADLNLAGYDCRSFIKDGVLVPPSPSPEVSLADDDQGRQVGEDVSSAVEPEGDEAPEKEAAPPS